MPIPQQDDYFTATGKMPIPLRFLFHQDGYSTKIPVPEKSYHQLVTH
ncbi:MAG: hypothetical protein F6J94_15530 [Moorea sp. SIO1F2]|nr:hypothetical protein [Moorena sp. SIO1F2]NET83273.1 hypothetical protein [Moorena sp. SIO1F2]